MLQRYNHIPWYIRCIVCDKSLNECSPERIVKYLVGESGKEVPVYSHLDGKCGENTERVIREKSGRADIPIVKSNVFHEQD
jgi:hypothetical protein